MCFNSRSRVGSDTKKEKLFQFTLPRGERQGWNKARKYGGLFRVLRGV